MSYLNLNQRHEDSPSPKSVESSPSKSSDVNVSVPVVPPLKLKSLLDESALAPNSELNSLNISTINASLDNSIEDKV
jgi:hypothetical protein